MGFFIFADAAAIIIFGMGLFCGHIGRGRREGPDWVGTRLSVPLNEFQPLVKDTEPSQTTTSTAYSTSTQDHCSQKISGLLVQILPLFTRTRNLCGLVLKQRTTHVDVKSTGRYNSGCLNRRSEREYIDSDIVKQACAHSISMRTAVYIKSNERIISLGQLSLLHKLNVRGWRRLVLYHVIGKF